MNEIKWVEGEVCFANGGKYFEPRESIVNADDFQLNEIRQGDYTEASELDTEQKYNDAVEVLGLFGFNFTACAASGFHDLKNNIGSIDNHDLTNLTCCDDGLFHTSETHCKRKITYPQLMAIGKLKRAMLDKVESQLIEISNASESPNSSEPKKSIDYLNECIEVQKQRGEQYDSKGTGERSFDAAAKAFNAMTGQNLKGSDVCLLLACVKAVRQYSAPTRVHEDSLLDLVSYASLWAEELNKELK
jgi:hypothetical protein